MSHSRIERMMSELEITDTSKQLVLCIGAAAIALLGAVTALTSPALTASETAAPAQAAGEFIYFPALYINQASEATEHIEAY